MPVDKEDALPFYGRDGQFTSIRKLVAIGQSAEFECLDISKHHKTNYPVKGKDYCFRVTLKGEGGQRLLLDLNGMSAIGQFLACLYPKGPEGPLVPCRVRLTRRAERRKAESELVVERVGETETETNIPF